MLSKRFRSFRVNFHSNGLAICSKYCWKHRILSLRFSSDLKSLGTRALRWRITGKYPGTIPPGTNGILMKPSPYGAVTDSGCESRSSNFPAQIGNTPSRKRYLMDRGQFTGQRLNLNDNLRGGKSGGDPDVNVPQAQGGVLQRNVFATC